jgi:hypothetical protein
MGDRSVLERGYRLRVFKLHGFPVNSILTRAADLVIGDQPAQRKSQAMEVGLEEEEGEEEDSQEKTRDREEEEETGGGEKQDGEGAYVTFEDEEHFSQHRHKKEENNNKTANC